jgi:hypothetical protein
LARSSFAPHWLSHPGTTPIGLLIRPMSAAGPAPRPQVRAGRSQFGHPRAGPRVRNDPCGPRRSGSVEPGARTAMSSDPRPGLPAWRAGLRTSPTPHQRQTKGHPGSRTVIRTDEQGVQ